MAGTSSGARFYIGPLNSVADDVSAYSALSYTEVEDVETIGEFGDSAQSVTFTALKDARVRKYKGAKDAGDLTVTCAHNPLDAGQVAMVTAEASSFQYAFKVVLADAADANDTDSVFYFRGKVMSKRLNTGGANDITKRTFVIGIDSEPVEDLSNAVS